MTACCDLIRYIEVILFHQCCLNEMLQALLWVKHHLVDRYYKSLLLIHVQAERCQSFYSYHTYSALKPLTCRIRICFTMVLFPDSPAPESEREREKYYGSVHMSNFLFSFKEIVGVGAWTLLLLIMTEIINQTIPLDTVITIIRHFYIRGC